MESSSRSFVPKPFQELLAQATPHCYVTPALVLMNVAYLAVNVLFGAHPLAPDVLDLIRFGAIYSPLVLEGEWWRLFSAAFVHVGFLHLLLNMWALWVIGKPAERMFGHATYLVIYLLSGLGGSLGTLLWRPESTSAGASGAIFGIMGAFLAFVHFGRIAAPPELTSELKRMLLIVTVLSLGIGFAFPFIDNAAHIGGLLVGLLLGAAMHRSLPDGRRSPFAIIALTATVAVLAGLTQWWLSRAVEDPRIRLAESMKLYAEESPEGATAKLEEAVALDPDLWEAHLQLGAIALEEGDFETAARALSRAVELNEEAAPYRPMLGFAYARIDELEKARTELDKALEENPDTPVVLSEVGIVQHRLGDNDEAIASLRKAVELEPENSEHHNRLSLVLAVTGDREGSLAAIEAALELEPRGAHLWDSRGTVYLYREEWPGAIESYRKAIQLDPESAIYHYNLSLALESSGDTEGAAEERARAFELEPELEPPPDDAPMIWS